MNIKFLLTGLFALFAVSVSAAALVWLSPSSSPATEPCQIVKQCMETIRSGNVSGAMVFCLPGTDASKSQTTHKKMAEYEAKENEKIEFFTLGGAQQDDIAVVILGMKRKGYQDGFDTDPAFLVKENGKWLLSLETPLTTQQETVRNHLSNWYKMNVSQRRQQRVEDPSFESTEMEAIEATVPNQKPESSFSAVNFRSLKKLLETTRAEDPEAFHLAVRYIIENQIRPLPIESERDDAAKKWFYNKTPEQIIQSAKEIRLQNEFQTAKSAKEFIQSQKTKMMEALKKIAVMESVSAVVIGKRFKSYDQVLLRIRLKCTSPVNITKLKFHCTVFEQTGDASQGEQVVSLQQPLRPRKTVDTNVEFMLKGDGKYTSGAPPFHRLKIVSLWDDKGNEYSIPPKPKLDYTKIYILNDSLSSSSSR